MNNLKLSAVELVQRGTNNTIKHLQSDHQTLFPMLHVYLLILIRTAMLWKGLRLRTLFFILTATLAVSASQSM